MKEKNKELNTLLLSHELKTDEKYARRMKSALALSYREKARDRQHGVCSCSSPRPVKNDKSYTKNRINICNSCGGTCSFFLPRVWDKEKYNFDSPRGIKRQTFGIRALMLYH